jgi:hypothetical protein
MQGSARYRQWAARAECHTCPPGSVEVLCRWAATIEVRELLAGLRVPTLVIHREGDLSVPVADGRYLAEHIPGAEYAELPGTDHTRCAERKSTAGTGWDSLTPSEQEVTRLIASGMTNNKVAARLNMSPHTSMGAFDAFSRSSA